jgi:hypothetical protein
LRFIPILYDGVVCHADHSNESVFALEPEARLSLMTIKENPSSHAAIAAKEVPFPQANNFEIVLSMLSIVAQHGDITKKELAPDFDLDRRQIDYYANILRWLGLVTVKDATIHMTDAGRKIAAMNHSDRIISLAEIVFAEPVFYQALRKGTKGVDASVLERWGITGETIGRRLSTVDSWIKYFRAFEK